MECLKHCNLLSTYSINKDSVHTAPNLVYRMQATGFQVLPGTSTAIIMSASRGESERVHKTNRVDQRDCLFSDESPFGPASYYPYYHPALCQLECALRKTELEFDCKPWDVPAPFEEGVTTVCAGLEARRFKQALSNHSQSACTECRWELCNQVTFSIKVTFVLEQLFVNDDVFESFSQVDTFATNPYTHCHDGAKFLAMQV